MSETTLTGSITHRGTDIRALSHRWTFWKNQHGDKAATIEVIYYPEGMTALRWRTVSLTTAC